MNDMPETTADGKLLFSVLFWAPESSGKSEASRWLQENVNLPLDVTTSVVPDVPGGPAPRSSRIFEGLVKHAPHVQFRCLVVPGGPKGRGVRRKIVTSGEGDAVVFFWPGDPAKWVAAEESLAELFALLKKRKEISPDVPLVVCLNASAPLVKAAAKRVRGSLKRFDLQGKNLYVVDTRTGANLRRAFAFTAREATVRYFLRKERKRKIDRATTRDASDRQGERTNYFRTMRMRPPSSGATITSPLSVSMRKNRTFPSLRASMTLWALPTSDVMWAATFSVVSVSKSEERGSPSWSVMMTPRTPSMALNRLTMALI